MTGEWLLRKLEIWFISQTLTCWSLSKASVLLTICWMLSNTLSICCFLINLSTPCTSETKTQQSFILTPIQPPEQLLTNFSDMWPRTIPLILFLWWSVNSKEEKVQPMAVGNLFQNTLKKDTSIGLTILTTPKWPFLLAELIQMELLTLPGPRLTSLGR